MYIKDLNVKARTSSFQFSSKGYDLREIQEKLNVKTIVEGSVQKVENNLRVTAQLINVEDGYHLWSKTYEETFDDIFSIQEEISFAIVKELKGTIEEQEQYLLMKKYTTDPEIYSLFKMGVYYKNLMGQENLRRAIDIFEKIIERESYFLPAYGELSDTYMYAGWASLLPADEAWEKARNYAPQALDIDETFAPAHIHMGMISAYYDFDYKEWDRRAGLVMAHYPGFY